MATTSPEADFYPLEETNGQGGVILWSDGHSIGAVAIEAAIAAGMKHFWDWEHEGEHYVLCSKNPFSSHVAKRYMELLEKQD